MGETPDYNFRDAPDADYYEPPSQSGRGRWVVGLIVIAVIGAAVYLWNRVPEPAPATAPGDVTETTAKPNSVPVDTDVFPVDVPPLDASDPLVRELVNQLSSHPRIAAWLATRGLIRSFTVVVTNVAEGKTPSGQLSVLRPAAKFAVAERGSDLVIDPRSYERFDALAAAAESLDPAGTAKLYRTLKPRIEEAHRELGGSDASFDATLERAIVLLLRTPVRDEPMRVEPKGIGYVFASPEVERLAPAQKQLLRTGPRNARAIQASLRNLARALGIPDARLPPVAP